MSASRVGKWGGDGKTLVIRVARSSRSLARSFFAATIYGRMLDSDWKYARTSIKDSCFIRRGYRNYIHHYHYRKLLLLLLNLL
jgi:hypothetical protein